MRGIADQCATRLARHGGAAAFTADELSMLCWAYSKLRVRRCLNIPSTTIVAPLDRHVHAALNALSATLCNKNCRSSRTMFALKVQLACLASIPQGTCEKAALCFFLSPLAMQALRLPSLALLCIPRVPPRVPGMQMPSPLIHPGFTSTPAAQLADHSELVVAACARIGGAW